MLWIAAGIFFIVGALYYEKYEKAHMFFNIIGMNFMIQAAINLFFDKVKM
jgi:hypothetical protein